MFCWNQGQMNIVENDVLNTSLTVKQQNISSDTTERTSDAYSPFSDEIMMSGVSIDVSVTMFAFGTCLIQLTSTTKITTQGL